MSLQNLPRRDIVATGLVVVAVGFYILWAVSLTLPGMSDTRTTAVCILALGFAASAIAVVPGFDHLIHGNKAYLAITSILGVVALVAGLQAMMASSGVALTVVIASMVALWAISTAHHGALAKRVQVPAPRETGRAAVVRS